ncbi:ATPase [Gloeothece citriformis PCC 7424]|uniref:ATPase n=1 Tax=Gloeothece citriformis (strain PCC 7424) TaxID=65393 RepID=B7KID7_GLOC7|nr:ATP-binding protein [Gloeothece citriformis]ACK73624.1 ATPase [Gloeothece citriformis PCC 7424]
MKSEPVPRLNLAPKLNRPLSLWNPLDYLLLLYWVFFFPQALRWYVETFGGGGSIADAKTVQEKWEFLQQHPQQLKLCIQALFLTLVAIIYFLLLLQTDNIFSSVNWLWIIVTITSFLLHLTKGVSYAVLHNVSYSVAISLIYALIKVIAEDVMIVGFGVGIGIAWNSTASIVEGVATNVAFGVGFILALALMISMMGILIGIPMGIMLADANNKIGEIVVIFVLFGGVGFGLIGNLSILRPENWLMGLPFRWRLLQNQGVLVSKVTCIPIPSLDSLLQQWLTQDWGTGIYNINQLLTYSLQSIPVVNAVNQVLTKIPSEHLIYRVSQLAENPVDWKLLQLASTSLNQKLKLEVIEGFFEFPFFKFLPSSWQTKLHPRFNTQPRLDTPPRAVAAGFWYLHKKKAERAAEAFAVVRSLLYGEEMYTLARTLAQWKPEDIDLKTIASLPLSPIPPEPQLRPNTWTAIKTLNRVIEDAKLIQQGSSNAARSFALNRAIGELREILDREIVIPPNPPLVKRGKEELSNLSPNPFDQEIVIPPNPPLVKGGKEEIPQAERDLILDIVKTWKLALERSALDLGKIAITEPIHNPYTIGDPVTGTSFVGREDILRQLQELWVMGKQLQSVVLYGHRRMGKTSILLNLCHCCGSDIYIVYVNLQSLGSVSGGMGEIFMAITDEIAGVLNSPRPDDETLLKLPEITFKRYLKTVIENLDKKGLIIALDEFETIETLIEAGQIPPEFMGYLRGLVQMSPKLAFIFAGLHTLEEMTADYFHPFFSSVISIKVSFLTRASTRQILANPDEEFLLNYTPEALEKIYFLTHGQPFLVQLIGFYLVRRYNDLVFEGGRTRDPYFTLEDVETIINEEFFGRGRYYFEGVWGQAAQGTPQQQQIIKILAPHPQGLTLNEIATATGIDTTLLSEALLTLKRHDVVEEKTDSRFRITVELFRQWVLCSK